MANPIVASPSPVIIRGLSTPVTVALTQASNAGGMSVFGYNAAMVSVSIAPTLPGATVGSAQVGTVGGSNTAVLSPGYTLTITPIMYGATRVMIAGDNGVVLSLLVTIVPTVIAGPTPPRIRFISQALSGLRPLVVVGVEQDPVTGGAPIVAFNLYRAPTPVGPYALIDTQLISTLSVVNQLFDANPIVGVNQTYAATAVDSSEYESGYSDLQGAAVLPLLVGTGPFPAGAPALGPYPLLGSDIFLNPATGEGVIGPNGDLLTVNGLYLLAQDLGIRLRTEIGELAMHQDYGFMKGKVIGRGQANPALQALNLQADVIECLYGDARVASVLDVAVSQQGATGWLISYTVRAIGVEDTLQANMVVPFWAGPGIIANVQAVA